jgi:hypothetical protein
MAGKVANGPFGAANGDDFRQQGNAQCFADCRTNCDDDQRAAAPMPYVLQGTCAAGRAGFS